MGDGARWNVRPNIRLDDLPINTPIDPYGVTSIPVPIIGRRVRSRLSSPTWARDIRGASNSGLRSLLFNRTDGYQTSPNPSFRFAGL